MEKIQDRDNYSRTLTKGESSHEKGPTTNQSINSTSSNNNMLRYFLAFQLAFINSSIVFSSSNQVSFNSSAHFSNLFSSSSQISFNSSVHFSILFSSSSKVSFNSSALFVPFIPSAV